MSSASCILNRVNLLCIDFVDAQQYSIYLYRCRYSKPITISEQIAVSSIDEDKKMIVSAPLIVLIYGYGIICKDADDTTGIVEKVVSSPTDFVWNIADDGSISFVRREQPAGVLKLIQNIDARVIRTEYALSCTDALRDTILNRYFDRQVTWRNILKPSVDGSLLARLMVKKLRLAILLLLLVLLICNSFISRSINNNYAEIHARYQAARINVGKTSELSRQKRDVINRFSRKLPFAYSVLCDRLALSLPQGVSFTNLLLQPLKKPVEVNAELQISDNKIVIIGLSDTSEQISTYISTLGDLNYPFRITLSSIEQNRDKNLFIFTINIEL